MRPGGAGPCDDCREEGLRVRHATFLRGRARAGAFLARLASAFWARVGRPATFGPVPAAARLSRPDPSARCQAPRQQRVRMVSAPGRRGQIRRIPVSAIVRIDVGKRHECQDVDAGAAFERGRGEVVFRDRREPSRAAPPQKRLRDVRRCAVLDCKRGAEHGDAVAPWVTRRLPFLTQRLR